MLKIKIYGGDKIGGCVTEVSSKNSKIIFDYGTNLDDTKQIDIEGLTKGKPQYNAVFISHYHLDHIGEISRISKQIPIYIEETTKKLYDIICDFSNKPKIKAKTFKFGEIIEVEDLKVTSYRVDHSAYNSAMFVVTDGEEKALYTGDFRDNGYTGNKLIPTIKEIGQVDYLITEGTNIGNTSHILRKEEALEEDFTKILNNYKQVFVLMSSSNIDRITTMLKACNKTKHILIQDLYMAHLTSLIAKEDKRKIPNPVTFDNVMVYKPKYFEKKKDEVFQNKYLNSFREKNKKSDLYRPFMMNIRTSMLKDLENFEDKNILTNSCLIYSMWDGYKKKEDIKSFIKKAKNLGITLIETDIHTSGHASEELIKQVEKIVNPRKVFIIHTSKGEKNMDFEEKLLKRYLGNKEFFVRVRNEKDKLAMKVYYNGIECFDYKNGKFNLNESVFIPNNTNTKNRENDKVPTCVEKDIKIINDLNFEFTVGSNSEDEHNKDKGKKLDLKENETLKNNKNIVKKLEKILRKYYPKLKKEEENNRYCFFIGKEENGIIGFDNLYELLFTVYKECKNYKNCPSINFGVELINNDISKLKNDFENSFTELDNVMKRRINVYCGKSKKNKDDYDRTKTDNNTEKQYQQTLMKIVYSKNKEKHNELYTRIFENKDVIPFEMEYSMYSEAEDNKTRSTPKGRIDNLFVQGNTLVMIELKMGTSVIGGTNGVHKHLLDLCTIFEHNDRILLETSDIINNRDTILKKYESTKNYAIGKNKDVKLENIQYYIICGYDDDETKGITKENVKEKLDDLYNKKITDVDLFKKNDKSKLTPYSKTIKSFTTSLKEKYDKNLLEKTIPDYISELNDKYNCRVEIYLANEDYTKMEPYPQ